MHLFRFSILIANTKKTAFLANYTCKYLHPPPMHLLNCVYTLLHTSAIHRNRLPIASQGKMCSWEVQAKAAHREKAVVYRRLHCPPKQTMQVVVCVYLNTSVSHYYRKLYHHACSTRCSGTGHGRCIYTHNR